MNKHIKNFLKLGLGAVLLSASSSAFADNQFDDLSQHEIVAAMGAGWNLGNTLEASVDGTPDETSWSNPKASAQLMKAVKSNGFNTIRIPVSYLSKIGSAPDYKIDAAWLARVKEVIDMALAEDLYVITNIHGDGYNSVKGGWLLCNASDQKTIKEKYKAFWTQIATEFKDYDEHLIFESMNEVFNGEYNGVVASCYDNINDYNQIFVETVRPISENNAKRWLLVPGWNTDIDQTSFSSGFKIPDDKYLDKSVSGKRLMISVHYYAPWDLCGDGTSSSITRWGDEAGRTASNKCCSYCNSESFMSGQFDKLKNWFTSQGYPVIVGEYGIVDKSLYDAENTKYAAYWTKSLCENARRVGAVPVLWDNGHLSNNKGFATINRATNSVARTYIMQAINEAFEQEIEIDTTAPTTKLEGITSYIVNLTVTGAKENPTYTTQFTDWSQLSKVVSLPAQNVDVDLSPASSKDGFTNLGYLEYKTDSLYSVTVNKITINGYEFSGSIANKTLKAASGQNGMANIWSGNDGEYLSDNGKAILSITSSSITLMIKTDDGSTAVNPVGANTLNILSLDGAIGVIGAEGKSVEVYTMLGSFVTRTVATDYLTSIQLPCGTYLVRIGKNGYKVVVK